ncbi:hypothetical protein ID875_06405 [Streptomyces globisporus]|uniref:Uncharacterized protein n=1 Tax=Streptomyces globisporus TaxID=1908 RepID=A0A927BJT2_STRGL|nr:hypothetical protein [Streptomyces globisporus]
MLQCTAITNLPHDEALPALLAMDDCPDDAEDLLDDKPYVLCELGEHDETTEHAARLWTAETEPPRACGSCGRRVREATASTTGSSSSPCAPTASTTSARTTGSGAACTRLTPQPQLPHHRPLRDAHHAHIRHNAQRAGKTTSRATAKRPDSVGCSSSGLRCELRDHSRC